MQHDSPDPNFLPQAQELIERRVTERMQAWTMEQIEEGVRRANEERRRETRRITDRLQELQLNQHELDRVLRGERGDNGLASDVLLLRKAEEQRQERERLRDRRQWAVLAIVVGLLISQAWERIFVVATP